MEPSFSLTVNRNSFEWKEILEISFFLSRVSCRVEDKFLSNGHKFIWSRVKENFGLIGRFSIFQQKSRFVWVELSLFLDQSCIFLLFIELCFRKKSYCLTGNSFSLFFLQLEIDFCFYSRPTFDLSGI